MAAGHGGPHVDQSSPLRRIPYRRTIGVVLAFSIGKVRCDFNRIHLPYSYWVDN
jgi:hypothetical protein